jgi:hypothetical protein
MRLLSECFRGTRRARDRQLRGAQGCCHRQSAVAETPRHPFCKPASALHPVAQALIASVHSTRQVALLQDDRSVAAVKERLSGCFRYRN